MTQQEAFNINWQHFVVNEQPASFDKESNSCMYRGPRNTKCGIGLLVKDEDYEAKWESGLNGNAYNVKYLIGSNLLPEYLQELPTDFLEAIQYAHDKAALSCHFNNNIVNNLREVAAEFHLTIPQ